MEHVCLGGRRNFELLIEQEEARGWFGRPRRDAQLDFPTGATDRDGQLALDRV
jgi:hypothetical protein